MKTAMRYDCLDALRAVAMLWMTAYHFCYDLNYFGWIKQDFIREPVWTWQRTCIVSLFLFCAGLSQAVAMQQGLSASAARPRFSSDFWRRWRQVAVAALLVSAGSYLMYPKSFIYFGVLHGIAVMLIVVRLTAGWGTWLWLLGALAIAMKFIAVAAHSAWPELAFLNLKIWNWLGFISTKPRTEDYVPLLPWLGVMWWGMAAGQWLLRQRPHWLEGLQGRGSSPTLPTLQALQRKLAVLGRYSLSYYLLHQPVLIGAMMLVKASVS